MDVLVKAQREYAQEIIYGRIPDCPVPRTEEEAAHYLDHAFKETTRQYGDIEFNWNDFRDEVVQHVEHNVSVDALSAKVVINECDTSKVTPIVLDKLREIAGLSAAAALFFEGDTLVADGDETATVIKARKNGAFSIKTNDGTIITMSKDGWSHKHTVQWTRR